MDTSGCKIVIAEKMNLSVRLVAFSSAVLALSGCGSLGIGGAGKANTPIISPPSAPSAEVLEVETRLNTEIAQLKSENARLRTQIKTLERSTQASQAVAREPSPPKERVQAQSPTKDVAAQSASKTTVVAAADADRALADAPQVAGSPRLVQPSIVDTDTEFENEAAGDIKVESVLYGVHLASYRLTGEAREGWRKLQRENPDELGLLEPRVERVSVNGRGVFLRLIGGGFSSEDKAEALCKLLKSKELYCAVASFNGDRLSLADAAG